MSLGVSCTVAVADFFGYATQMCTFKPHPICVKKAKYVLSKMFYKCFIALYGATARLLAPFNPKARLWIEGRKDWERLLAQKLAAAQLHEGQAQVVWMHASSLGEFEQGRPLLEALKLNTPGIKIVVSFFSPSGFLASQHTELADLVTYLPEDTPHNATRFLQLVKPNLVIWVKYDYWYYFLKALHTLGVPVLLVSAIFRANQPFFKWYGGLHRQMLHFFNHLFVQNMSSLEALLQLVPSENMTVSGDTRFDRVEKISLEWSPVTMVENWLANSETVVVAGSTWPHDEAMLQRYAADHPTIKFVIAPHQVNPAAIAHTVNLFAGATLFSELDTTTAKGNVLIINNIGMLNRLYRYGKVCYIGGGFTKSGVHNVLEAAVYGKPVLHGPVYQKFAEAVDLLQAGGSYSVDNTDALALRLTTLLADEGLRAAAGNAAKQYVLAHTGGTARVVKYIYENRLLTN
jgi:3-deoxy-D-manno-octulosonic-acid transferase